MARLRLTALLVAGALAALPAVARADGDPASDVLVAQNLFLPADAGIGGKQEAQLEGVLNAAARAGYPVRLAVISTRSDLGSITALWRQPVSYAAFLGQELSLAYRGRVLVAMPGGYGLYFSGTLLPAERTALAAARGPGSGPALAAGANAVVQSLARAARHPLTVTPASSTPTARAIAGSGGAIPWLVFALGAAVIAAAWTVSLRARPVRLRSRGVSSG